VIIANHCPATLKEVKATEKKDLGNKHGDFEDLKDILYSPQVGSCLQTVLCKNPEKILRVVVHEARDQQRSSVQLLKSIHAFVRKIMHKPAAAHANCGKASRPRSGDQTIAHPLENCIGTAMQF
jgi:hypothetical protein